MRRTGISIVIALLFCPVLCHGVNIPDANFRAWINANCPGAMTGNSLNEQDPCVLGMTFMNVSGSNISNLSGIWAFTNVQFFDASNNPITQAGMAVPPQATTVWFNNCLLSGSMDMDQRFPGSVLTVHLSNNQLTSVHWCSTCSLQGLYADHNQIATVLGTAPWSLNGVDLSYNLLATPPVIPNCAYLVLSHNLLTAPPATSGGNGSSSVLDVSANLLTTLPSQLCSYRSVNVSNNLINAVGDLFQCNTVHLDLSNNPLASGIGNLPRNLETCSLSNTQLACLPFLPWPLQTLICTGNGFSCLPNIPNAMSLNPANFGFTPTECPVNTTCAILPPQLRMRTSLQGAWVFGPGLMRDDLRSQGLLPLNEPYTALGYSYFNNIAPLSVPASAFAVTGPHAIVDWVVVEFRQYQVMPGQVQASMPALLRRDGWVVSTTGDSVLTMNLPRGVYRIAVKHRNHLGAITFQTLNLMNGQTVCDMMYNPALTNSFAMALVGPTSIRMMVQGDANGDKVVKYTGASNDRDLILQAIGGVDPTNTLQGQYRLEDLNLDGVVKYTGALNDRDLVLQTVGGSTPTQSRTQLPLY